MHADRGPLRAIGIFDESGAITEFITHGLSEQQRRRIGELPRGRGILGLLHRLQQPLRTSDLAEHPEHAGFPRNHPPMRSFVGAPIRYGDLDLGSIYLTEKAGGGAFTHEDEQVLTLFANQAALALHNAHLHEQVREERRRLDAILEASPVGIWVVDNRGRTVLFNREARRLAGVVNTKPPGNLASLLGQHPGEVALWDGEPPVRRVFERGETVLEAAGRLAASDGTDTPVLVSAAPLLDDAGTVTEAIVILQDITKLKALEEVKDDFMSMVTHDLKSPLAVIKAIASAALLEHEAQVVPVPREWLENIEAEVDWTTELTGNLSDMARLESGPVVLDLETCDITEVLEEAIHHHQLLQRPKPSHLITQVEEGLPLLTMDYNQIKRVVLNLLGNAAKYSDPVAPIIVRAEATADGMIAVEIEDRGVGLNEEEQRRVFDKYYRSPSQRHGRDASGRRPGTGLGLAICNAIIRAHQGRIWVRSVPGQGSTFGFALPRH